MAVVTNKSIFYHIPKTGGMFVKAMMRHAMDVETSGYARTRGYYGPTENELTDLKRYLAHSIQLRREHITQWEVNQEQKKDKFSFAFVREPLAWYKSFWAFRKTVYDTNEFNRAFPLDFAWDVDFEKFINNVINMYPLGFVSILYKCYLGQNGDELDFVGKQENLKEDLIKALTLAGEDFDKRGIIGAGRNNAKVAARGFSENMGIGGRTKSRLLRHEHWVLDTFYKK